MKITHSTLFLFLSAVQRLAKGRAVLPLFVFFTVSPPRRGRQQQPPPFQNTANTDDVTPATEGRAEERGSCAGLRSE